MGADGVMVGVVPIEKALGLARDGGLDLVEVSPMAAPPVCKIIDYGKFKYERQKKQMESRRKGRSQQIKEIRLRPAIDQHDYEVKLRGIKGFLADGHRVRVSVVFRGREIVHRELGERLMACLLEDLSGKGKAENAQSLQGKTISVMVAPA